MATLRRASWPWLAVCLLGLCGPVWAASHPLRYDIAAGPLDDVLRAFASRSGIQLLYPPEQTEHLQSNGLHGVFDPQQALALLLSESGLNAQGVAENTFVLSKTPAIVATAPSDTGIAAPIKAIPLARVEVTGTHLRRTELETAGPLTVITRRQIEHSGYQTLYELLRSQPGIRVNNTPVAMTDGSAYQNNGLSGATGASSVDLHGLGPTATLLLVDGQRMAGYGLAQGKFGLVNDLGSIPLAMIERIEVLRDGASAIYGSDAMAGVINIILRKQFDGVDLNQVAGSSTHGDARQWRDSATFGTTTAGGSHLLMSLDYLARSPLLGRQRNWAVAAGRSGVGPSGEGGDIFYFDNGQIRHTGVPACTQSTLDGPCDGNPVAQTNLLTGLDSRSVLAHADHPLGSFTLYADARWTLIRQRQQMGPATDILQVQDPSQPSGYHYLTYAFNDLGPVRDDTLSRGTQLSLGLRGLTAAWAWDLRLDSQANAGTDQVFGLPRTSVLDKALADGSYQPGSASNPRGLLARLAPPLSRSGLSTQNGFSARVNGPLGDWPGGPLSLAAGVESYHEQLKDHPDPALIDNDVFQFQPPYVQHGDRWVSAAYLELEAALGPHLTANLAGRVDHTGGFGTATSPRLGLKWDITDAFSLRGTLARGYRAPTLPELDRPQSLTPSGVTVEVPNALLPCAGVANFSAGTKVCTLRLDTINNPDLQPERSRSLTLGLVFAPTPDLGIALDAYQIHRYHEINELPVSYALMHPESYPQLFQRDANGVLYAFDQQLVNLGHTSVRSYDLDTRYRLETDRLGQFTFNLGLDWLAELRRQVQPGAELESLAGYAGQPRLTALAGLEWVWNNWDITGNLRYTGHYAFASSNNSQATCPTAQQQAEHCTTPSFTLVDLGLEYAGFRHWRLGLHINNVTDHQPVFYGYPAVGYSPAFDDVVGRYLLLSIRYRHEHGE